MPSRDKPDAIALLKEDHRKVEDLFEKADKARDEDRKKMLVQYCAGCHNDKMKTANMSVLPLDAAKLESGLDAAFRVPKGFARTKHCEGQPAHANQP